MYNEVMRYSWNEAKRVINLKKHHLDFRDAHIIFDGLTVTIEDKRFDYGEDRFISIGFLHGIIVLIAHAEMELETTIILMRKATRYEEKIFLKTIGK